MYVEKSRGALLGQMGKEGIQIQFAISESGFYFLPPVPNRSIGGIEQYSYFIIIESENSQCEILVILLC